MPTYTKDKNKYPLRDGSSCPHDPAVMVPMPLGMYHCPECGIMVVAGLKHPPDTLVKEAGITPFREATQAHLLTLKKPETP